jgi:hypothetical protein
MLNNTEFLYNNSIYTTTKVSPFFALYSYHLNTRHFIKKEVSKGDVLITRERGKEMIKIWKTLDKQLLSAIKYQSKWYNNKHKIISYTLGD